VSKLLRNPRAVKGWFLERRLVAQLFELLAVEDRAIAVPSIEVVRAEFLTGVLRGQNVVRDDQGRDARKQHVHVCDSAAQTIGVTRHSSDLSASTDGDGARPKPCCVGDSCASGWWKNGLLTPRHIRLTCKRGIAAFTPGIRFAGRAVEAPPSCRSVLGRSLTWCPVHRGTGALAALVTLFAASPLFTQIPEAKSAQTGRRSPTPTMAIESLTGRHSFDHYCASCHGADGRGGGTVGSVLRNRPTDLTTLARRNGGTFPRERVAAFVEGTQRLSLTHGSGDMPVWGKVLRGLESSDARIRVRLANLVAYVESLQVASDQAPPARSAEPMSGAQLFRTHCASCHGETAGGAGPISAQLRNAVPDLTTFSARNGGMFPAERVRQMIEGRGPTAHGDRSMPVWGDVFRRQGADAAAAIRIDSIVTFLQSIQRQPAE
jgi:mono/diheme cytochrome c family protein